MRVVSGRVNLSGESLIESNRVNGGRVTAELPDCGLKEEATSGRPCWSVWSSLK